MGANDDADSKAGTPIEQSVLQLSPEASAAVKAVGRLLAAPVPAVAAGQLWRAVWAGESVLGCVLEVEDDWAQLAPLTVDAELADPFTGVLAADQQPLPVTIAVFAGLTTAVPLFTLQAFLGQLDPEIADQVRFLWRANLAGERPNVEIATGSVDVDAVEARREFRLELSGQLTRIAIAELTSTVAEQPLAERLKSAGMKPSVLSSILAIDLAQARSLAAGRAPLTVAQAETLADRLGVEDPTQLLGTTAPPLALLRVLHDPRRFAKVRQLAIEHQVDEAAMVARLPSLLAARRQGLPDDQWDERFWAEALDKLTGDR